MAEIKIKSFLTNLKHWPSPLAALSYFALFLFLFCICSPWNAFTVKGMSIATQALEVQTVNCTYLHTCCRYNCILTGCMSSCRSLGCWYSRHWQGSHVNHWYIHSRLGIRKKCLCSIQGADIFRFMIKKESSFVWHQVMFEYLVQFQQLKAPDGPSILEFWRFMKFKYEKLSICKY